MTEIKRNPDGTFVKGQTGNPAGLPKRVIELREICRAETPQCIAKLIALRDRGETEAVQLQATLALLDRGWGRPAASIDVDLTIDRKLNELSTAQLMELRNKVITLPALEVANGFAGED